MITGFFGDFFSSAFLFKMNSLFSLRLSSASASLLASRSRVFSPRVLFSAQTGTVSPATAPVTPIEKKLADETLTLQAEALRKLDPATLKDGKAVPAKIAALAEAVVALNLIEAMQLSEVLKAKLGVSDMAMPMMHSGGMAPPAAAAPVAVAAAAPAAAAAPPKEEKAHVDIKLKAFKPENKIKVIKEVRAVTNLGLKEAMDLVESAPCTLMTKVKKEEALKIIEKLKTETGAELELA